MCKESRQQAFADHYQSIRRSTSGYTLRSGVIDDEPVQVITARNGRGHYGLFVSLTPAMLRQLTINDTTAIELPPADEQDFGGRKGIQSLC